MLLRSMTGFGEAKRVNEDEMIYVGVKSVNNKNLVINISAPSILRSMETKIIAVVKERIHRGTVSIYLHYSSFTDEEGRLVLNKGVLKEYYRILQEIKEELGLEKDDISISNIAVFPGIVESMDIDVDTAEIWKKIEPVLNEALNHLDESRIEEGNALRVDLMNSLTELETKVSEIDRCASSVVETYRKRIREMVENLTKGIEVDSKRLEEEVVMVAIRADVNEELVRLKHHMNTARKLLSIGGVIGKKLDFILQEMHRELNTLGVKSPDSDVSSLVVDAKTLVSKMKEQAFNVE